MKKLYLLIALCLIIFLDTSAQDSWYYDKGSQKELAIERSKERSEASKESRKNELFAKQQVPGNLKSASGTLVTTSTTDSLALVALFNATDGPNWTNNADWLSGPVSNWFGITVNSEGRVTEIDLDQNNLINSLPSELGQLSELQSLVLWGNSLSGEIPSELGNLTNLYRLDLGLNQLTGSIPTSLGGLTNLQYLYIGSNGLTGEIPTSLGYLENLVVLALDVNELSGEIPSELGNLPQLSDLYLQINQLTGAIPESFQNLNLFFLDLGGNSLTGAIPDFLGLHSNLMSLNLWGNQFEGSIPESLMQLGNLSLIDLTANLLTGSIPANIDQLSLLSSLYLGWNQLSDTIPSSIGNLSNLFWLDLMGNQYDGAISENFENLGVLEGLYLAYNDFSGSLPAGLCNTPIQYADFSGNWFDESACEAYTCLFHRGAFGNVSQTQQSGYELSSCLYNPDAYCENISLVGDFNNWGNDGPDVEMIQNRNDSTEWTVKYNFTQAGSVKFRQNESWDVNWGGSSFPDGYAQHDGSNIWVPTGYYNIHFNCVASTYSFENLGSFVTSCSEQDSLALVDLYNSTDGDNWINNENWLNGPVASWYGVVMEGSNVKELWLDQNNLSDTLPASLGQLSQLEIIAMGGNGFGGQIPDAIGTLTNLRYLWLWGNQMTGEVPATLGQLSNLNILSLNGNNLSGNIPEELGSCNNLWVINLDWNYLDGEIPTELCNIENLSSANFAYNNFDSNSCAAITCLTSKGVSFADSPDQIQRNGYSLINDCGYVADSVWVTFCVNMQNESISANGIHINGSFSGWSEAVEMQLDSGAYYSARILLEAGQTFTYKFVNGGTYEWEMYEVPPSGCTIGENNDRELYVPFSGSELILNAVCFAGCTNCADNTVPQYTIHEIQGDSDVSPLLGQVIRTKGRITGVNQYGFFVQDTTGARSGIFVYDSDLASELDQGDHIEIIAEVAEYNGKTELMNVQWFDYTDELFDVYTTEIGVSEVGEDYEGVFVKLNYVTVIAENAYQEYIVVSESNDTTIIDNYLIQPYMEIGGSYIVYGIVDYQYGSFTVNPRSQSGIIRLRDLTFRVNMQNETVDPAGVFVGGDWNDWMSWAEPEQMTADGDIYYATVRGLAEGSTINYKFINGTEWESVSGACSVGDDNNRYYTIPNSSDTLDIVCFGGCTNCADNSVPQYTIHDIQGDGDASPLEGQVVRTKGRITAVNQYGFYMQDASWARNGIFVYDPNLAAQLSQGDDIEIIGEVEEYNERTELMNVEWYDYTDEEFEVYLSEIEVSEIGEDFEDVFVRLNYVTVIAEYANQKYIVVSETGDTTIIDNYLMQPDMEVGGSYIVNGIVDYLYGSFTVNPRSQSGITRLYDITFQVDMQNEVVDPAGVFIGGDWNDWLSWVEPEQMTANGSIYSLTVKAFQGRTIYYRFRNGEEWENVIGECGEGENGDRMFVMPGASTTLDLVCFSRCLSCDSLNSSLPVVSIDDASASYVQCYGDNSGLINVAFSVSDVGIITDKGVMIGNSINLVDFGNKISAGSGPGSSSLSVDELGAGEYFLCAYAETENGTSYSDLQQLYIAQPDYLEIYNVTETLGETSVYYYLDGAGGVQPYHYKLTLCSQDSPCVVYDWQTESYFSADNLEQLKTYTATLDLLDANGCITSNTYSFMLAPDNSLQIDSIALVALYNATDGPNWTNNANWLSGPLNTWYGVTVQDGRVTAVDLNNNNLIGTLPSRIGKLNALASFVVWGNQLTGELPPELGNMSSLVTLDLGVNQFYGEIPSELGELSNLEILFIGSGSQLTGEIPSSFGQLSNLRVLALDWNQLSGTIPEELGNLSQLTDLFLQGNQLYGVIPDSFDGLASLNVLNVSNNSFSGELPMGFCNLPLGTVNLEQNYFHIYSCDVIRCLTDNGVVFEGDPAQLQKNGIELTQDCMLPSLEMIDLLAPDISGSILCNPTSDESVILSFYNDGNAEVEGATLIYLLNGDTIAVEYYSGTIYPADTITYEFAAKVDLIPPVYTEKDTLKVILRWDGGMINGWASTNTFKAYKNDTGFDDWTIYNRCSGLLSDISWAITEDGDGNIWSTSFVGADRFDGNQWDSYTVANGLTENYSWVIDHDANGNIWFAGASDSIITKYDGNDFTLYAQPTLFNECIYNDSQGNMWFGSWDGLGVARFDGQNWTYFMKNEVGFGDHIMSIGEDANGNIWVSSFSTTQMMFIYDGNSWQQTTLPSPADNMYISEIYYDSKGNTWFASSNMVARYNGSDWQFYDTNDGVLSVCEDISEDIYGNIWFGGGYRIVKFDGSEWTQYTAGDGMTATNDGGIYALYADSQGNIWVGTYNGGISKYDIPEEKICTSVHFQNGWNLFSTPVGLDSARVGYNFQPLIDNGSLVKIQDEEGNAFEYRGIFGGWDDSEMKLLRPYDGFKINVSKEDSIQFCGTPVTYPYPIYLYEGWNIMGYPQSIVADADDVIGQLIDRGTLLKVQDEAGNSIEDLGAFGGWTNFIGNFIPGEGYKIKVDANDTLWIYDSYEKSTIVTKAKVQTHHFASRYYGNGVDHMNLNIVDLPGNVLTAGDELAIFDGVTCVGAVTILPQNLTDGVVAIAVSATDDYGMPGFNEGGVYELRLWKAENQFEQVLQPDILTGPEVFVKHESAILSLKNFTGVEDGLLQNERINCYPNPFNNKLIIEATLADNRNVDIQILNQLGQKVNYLVNKQEVNPGVHRWIWSGDNASGQKVEPGIYYVRFCANENTVVNKVVLTK